MKQPKKKARRRNEWKNAVMSKVGLMTRRLPIRNATKDAKTAVTAAGVVLAGPIVSFLPLGPYTAILSLLATSIASSHLKHKVIGGVIGFFLFVSASSYSHPNRRVDKLSGTIHAMYKESAFTIGFSRPESTQLFLFVLSELLELPWAIPVVVRTVCTNVSLLASQSYATISSTKPSFDTSKPPLRLLIQTLSNLYTMDKFADDDVESLNSSQDIHNSIPSNIDPSPSPEIPSYQFSSEEWSEERDVDEDTCDDGLWKGGSLNDEERRTQALFDELNHLIDECDGLNSAQWNEVIELLNENQGFDLDGGECMVSAHFEDWAQRDAEIELYHANTANMRTYDDSFSGQKIYPGKGKLYIRGDSKIFRFQNGKSESLFLQRKNPRKIHWTTLYRRAHKKGISEEVAKKRTRRTVKHQRAIVGASLDVIKERRSQRPEARAAARSAAVKEGKEKKAAAESAKKAEKAKNAAASARGNAAKVSKQGAKGAAPKVQARTR
ncbi:ribosomal protein L24e-domain-containing protein [Bipolaris maydis]|nr:ribosomal protein L24e-domain-containing protein [Bipolaris maydis]KAJ6274342.1 ribosomal protein L24e-domain-containing protein [Bipolaris maydis]KAJ6286374.1 ribosomal protein L24e-domain-containing protein [Bipolaris maydis]